MNCADLVGVDIGGTKTRIRVLSDDGAIDDFTTLTAQWRPVEQRPNPLALLALITERAALGERTVVAVGAHGCDTRAQCADFAAGLASASPGFFTVVNDAELLVPAAGLTTGIGMVIGTGSIVVGEDEDGALLSVGGWGWLLGDPGSAPALVREAARAVLAAADRGHPLDPLGKALCVAYGVDTPLQLAYQLTAARRITEWAEAAPVVFESALQGSELAAGVLRAQANELVRHVLDLRARGAQGESVVIGGGVAAGQPEFAASIAERLTDRTGLSVTVLAGPPIDGAMALAQRRRDRDTAQPHQSSRRHPHGGSSNEGDNAP